jgi:hypothetical protein
MHTDSTTTSRLAFVATVKCAEQPAIYMYMGFLNLEKPILRNEFRAPGRTVPEELRS